MEYVIPRGGYGVCHSEGRLWSMSFRGAVYPEESVPNEKELQEYFNCDADSSAPRNGASE
jgi:hypothetical protein